MGIPISVIFLFTSLIVFWIIPAIDIQNQIKLPLGKRYARLRLI